MTRRAIRTLVGAFALMSVFLPYPALAKPTKSQCVDANTAGQAARLSGKLKEAREQLTLCGEAACPAIVRTDCIQRLDEIAKIQPTIVLGVKGTSGVDLTQVTVTVDGQLFTDKLDGTALPVDPGSHAFVFTIPGEPPVTRNLVIQEGEKGRIERVSLAPPLGPPSATSPGADAPSGLGTQRTLGVSAGAAGLAGVAVGAIFGALAISAADAQKQHCSSPTDCPDHDQALKDHADAETFGLASTISFIAGGTLLLTGPILFLTAPSPRPKAAKWIFVPVLSPSSGGVSVVGRF